MTSKLFLGCGAAALLLAACDGPPPAPAGIGPNALLKVPARLDCPERQGDLERVRVAPDGRSCAYRGENGSTVDLRLTPVSGSADATLAQIEAGLRKAEQQAAAAAASAAAPKDAAEGDAVAGTADGGMVEVDADHHDVNVNVDHPVNIRLPGVRIDARDEGADIRIGSLRVKADGAEDRVMINREPHGGVGRRFSLTAGDGGAEIRSDDGGKANVKAMLILATEAVGNGEGRAVGYVARGPRSGPLVVATLRMVGTDNDELMEGDNGGFDAAGDLVKRNVRRR